MKIQDTCSSIDPIEYALDNVNEDNWDKYYLAVKPSLSTKEKCHCQDCVQFGVYCHDDAK